MTAVVQIHIVPRLIGTRSPLLFGHVLEHVHRQIYGGIYDPASKPPLIPNTQ